MYELNLPSYFTKKIESQRNVTMYLELLIDVTFLGCTVCLDVVGTRATASIDVNCRVSFVRHILAVVALEAVAPLPVQSPFGDDCCS